MIIPGPPGIVKATLTSDELDTDTIPIVGALVSVITDIEALDELDVGWRDPCAGRAHC